MFRPVVSGRFSSFCVLHHLALCVDWSKLDNGVEREDEYEGREMTAEDIKRTERATARISYSRAPTDPRPAVDRKPRGKRAKRKMKTGAVDHRGVVRRFSSQNQKDAGSKTKVPPSLVIQFFFKWMKISNL